MICHCSQQSPTDLSKLMGTMPGTEIIEMEEVVLFPNPHFRVKGNIYTIQHAQETSRTEQEMTPSMVHLMYGLPISRRLNIMLHSLYVMIYTKIGLCGI